MIQPLQQKNSTDRTYSRYTHSHTLVSKFVVDIKHTVLLISINDKIHISPSKPTILLLV